MSELAETPAHPALPPRSRGRRRRRQVLRLPLLIAAVIALGFSGVAGALVLTAGGALQRIEVAGLGGAPEPGEMAGVGQPPADDRRGDGEHAPGGGGHVSGPLDEPVTLLLVGTDSREGLSERQLQALGTEDHGAVLTDGLMLVRLDPREPGVTVLSLPRDLLVQRCDGTRGRINQAYHIGEENGDGEGATCLVETVVALTGLRIDHYAQVNMAGFIDVVDLLGGISLHLEEPLTDPAAGLDLPAGCVELDGKKALAFVRARKSLGGGGDLDRIARQQRLLGEVVQEATDAGTLANLPKLFTLASTAGRAVETDEDLSLNLLRRLALAFRDAGEQDIAAFTVPAEEEVRSGAYYLVPTEEADEIFEAFADGTLGIKEPGPRPPRTSDDGAGTAGERSDRLSGDAAHGGAEPDAPGTPGTPAGAAASDVTC